MSKQGKLVHEITITTYRRSASGKRLDLVTAASETTVITPMILSNVALWVVNRLNEGERQRSTGAVFKGHKR